MYIDLDVHHGDGVEGTRVFSFHIQMSWNFKVLDISTISLFLERILMGHIEPIYSLESKL